MAKKTKINAINLFINDTPFFVINPIAMARLKDRAGFSRKRIVAMSTLASNKTRHTDDEKALYAYFEKQLNELSKYGLEGNEYDLSGTDGSRGAARLAQGFKDLLKTVGLLEDSAEEVRADAITASVGLFRILLALAMCKKGWNVVSTLLAVR